MERGRERGREGGRERGNGENGREGEREMVRMGGVERRETERGVGRDRPKVCPVVIASN